MQPMKILDANQLHQAAPSIYAQEPWERMSNKYRFVPTYQVLEAMQKNGFAPVRAQQSRTRIEGKSDFTKHMIRFRHVDFMQPDKIGQEIPEIVLVNSHDGTSAYQLHAGLFRLVCMNGLIVASAQTDAISVRHSGKDDLVSEVIEGSFRIIEDFPKHMAQIEQFKTIELDRPQQEAFAAAAAELRPSTAPENLRVQHLLHARRRADAANENGSRGLWETFNAVQENMMQGGLTFRAPGTRRRQTVRGVKSVNEDIRINRALWRLTEEMGKIQAAA